MKSITVTEAAELLGISRQKVWRYIESKPPKIRILEWDHTIPGRRGRAMLNRRDVMKLVEGEK